MRMQSNQRNTGRQQRSVGNPADISDWELTAIPKRQAALWTEPEPEPTFRKKEATVQFHPQLSICQSYKDKSTIHKRNKEKLGYCGEVVEMIQYRTQSG